MTTMPGTAVTTRTQIELQDNYEDFDAAWASVQAKVMEFVNANPGARITIDDTSGLALYVSVLKR